MADKQSGIQLETSNHVYERSDPEKDEEDDGCCRSCTNKLNRALENFFASVGYAVGNNPWKTIIISLIGCALCFIGVIEYQVENRGFKNWVSQTSDAIKHKDWVDEVFPAQFRRVYILLEKEDGSNILTPEAIRELRNIDSKVRMIYNGTANRQWKDTCFTTDADLCVPPKSILELWSYNDASINNLTDAEIKNTLDKKTFISLMTGQSININALIGVPQSYSPNGSIVSASVLKITYQLKARQVFVKSSGRLEDEDGEAWEEKLDQMMTDLTVPGFNTYSFSLWANNKAAGDASNGDTQFFIVGYILVIIYLAIVLGSFSRLNHKIYLALGGILTIGLSIGVAYGLGSGFQLKSTPVHNVLPFLLLGIGVDDIFVIVQSWDNIGGPKVNGNDKDTRTIAEKISLTIRHAGVSVLVTSLTDICAFLIGATTILPALRSFCIWCGLGILSVFLLTITFFTALLALDAKRQENNRDACCCCCVKIGEDWTPTKCSKKSYLQNFIQNYYAPTILSVPGKIISMIVIAGLLAGGIYGVAVELEQDFDFTWFLPSDSRPRMYTDKDKVAFPNDGFFGNVYIGNINYYEEHEIMNKIVNKLNNDEYIGSYTVKSWYHSYYQWLKETRNSSLTCSIADASSCRTANESLFYSLLQDFLNDPKGKFYSSSIKYANQSKTDIRASKIGYIHTKFEKAVDEIKGMESVQDEINPNTITVDPEPLLPFAHAPFYISWETNKVISEELGRNLGLAMMCVFLVTLFLLSNFFASFLVLICVVLALIDITGFMAFWGLTIDTVTTIILVIAIGLTVDYSAHIAHAFMVSRDGDKNERTKNALSTVGPAVVNGGFSTFLAFVLLAASTSYVFFTFFKVFFLVVLFGMLHGLLFLPIMLSLVGPRPYARNESGSVPTKCQVNGHSNQVTDDQQQISMDKMKREDEEVYNVVEERKGGTTNVSYAPE